MGFKVDDVELGPPLQTYENDSAYVDVWQNLQERRFNFEQSSPLPQNTVDYNFNSKNMFLESVSLAYEKHYPLKITPDIIWITIMQGFAKHINKNAEKFRKDFVSHEGKKLLTIYR